MEKLEFPITGKFLYILKIVINYKIFSETVVFGHFDQIANLTQITMKHKI